MTWYVETRTPFGTWAPELHAEKPVSIGPEGRKHAFRATPVEVPAAFEGFSLGLIRRALAEDGDLRFVPPADLAAFLRDPGKAVLVVPA